MKIALVTGANKGIGREVARQLAKKGMKVLVGARDKAKGEAAVGELRAENLDVELLVIDTADEKSVAAAAKEVEQRHGKLDALVNNAGVYLDGKSKPSELPLAVLKETYQTNVFGPVAAIRSFLPLLRKAQAGRIVNVSSTLGSITSQADPKHPFYGSAQLAYHSSKSALNAVTVQFAKELSATPIKVNAACPGWVKTDMGSQAAPRTVDQGAKEIVRLATLGDEGPTGTFSDENGPIPW